MEPELDAEEADKHERQNEDSVVAYTIPFRQLPQSHVLVPFVLTEDAWKQFQEDCRPAIERALSTK